MLTQERVRELFRYEDGNLIRLVNASSTARAGWIAGSLTTHGYLSTRIDKVLYYNHRLVFLFHHGYTPENYIDHIDRNPLNNRIENLREVSNVCNIRNSKQLDSNTSGVKGVYFNKVRQKWAGQITTNNRAKNLGIFSDFTEAVAHRLAAEQCLNWNECDSNSPAFQYMQSVLRSSS